MSVNVNSSLESDLNQLVNFYLRAFYAYDFLSGLMRHDDLLDDYARNEFFKTLATYMDLG
jgi:hypothetical protein